MDSLDRTPILFSEGAPGSVIVFRALQFGDLLCAVPAFRALRVALPQARITLVGLPWAADFVARFGMYIDDLLEFPGYPGLPEREPDLRALPGFFQTAQQRDYDLAIQMHGSGSYVNSISVMLGAKHTAGFFVKGEYCPDPARFLPYPESEHEIWKNLRLLEFLGIPREAPDLEFPITVQDQMEYDQMEGADQLQAGSYVCVHPGARLLTRRWPPERFSLVGDALNRKGFTVVLTGSPDEMPLVRLVESLMKTKPVNMAGKTTAGALAVLLRNSRLLVSNDTGVSHIAAALRVPSVIVVLGSDPARWRPLDERRHRILIHDVNCRPCYYMRCPIGHPCATSIATGQVLEMASQVLKDFPFSAPRQKHPLAIAAGAHAVTKKRRTH